MATPVQVPCILVQTDDDQLGYTPAAAVIAGDVIIQNGLPLIASRDIAASAKGALKTEGVFKIPKNSSVFAFGDPVFWNPTGTPQLSGAAASSGTATTYANGYIYIGTCVAAAVTGDNYVNVMPVGKSTSPLTVFSPAQYTTAALSSTTASAGQLTGSAFVVMNNSGATPGTYTTRTATQMYADIPNCQVGLSYLLRIANGQGTGTLTVAGGTGVTVTGTATIAINTYRDYVVTFNSTTTMTLQNVGSGTAP